MRLSTGIAVPSLLSLWSPRGAALSGVIAAAMWVSATASAAPVLLASADLGAEGQVGGLILAANNVVGWRFTISNTLVVDAVGGHLSNDRGSIFAALVSLASPDSIPGFAPKDLANNAIAGTSFSVGFPSQDFLTPLHAVLMPGTYALLLGGGEQALDLNLYDPAPFGATGHGLVPDNNSPIEGTSEASNFFFAFERPDAWSEFSAYVDPDSLLGYRFLVSGHGSQQLPEPSAFLLAATALAALQITARFRLRRSVQFREKQSPSRRPASDRG
jgi:hypothetical protein